MGNFRNFFITFMMLIFFFIGCTDNHEVWVKLEMADSLMEEHPDSSLIILESLSKGDLKSSREKARYALLMSMALDKNYVDTTTFDILQPAIDYYPMKGTPDEKLRTYYYQGRIYQNIGDEENALKSFMDASSFRNEVTDSLTLGNLLVAQGVIYIKQYKTKEFIKNNLEAAEIYGDIGKSDSQINSFTKAINGLTIEDDKETADSLIKICMRLVEEKGKGESYLFSSILSYLLRFGTDEEIAAFLNENQNVKLDQSDAINFGYGYSKIGDNKRALEYLSTVQISDRLQDSLKLAAVKTEILENAGLYNDALQEYKNFSGMLERHQYELISKDLLSVEKRYEMEKSNMLEIQRKNNVIWLVLSIVFALLIVVGFIFYRYKLGIAKNQLMAEEKTILQLEKENLILQINRLEEESVSLKEVIEKQKDISQPIKDVIKNRLEILNGLLAKEITNNNSYAKDYIKWIETIKKDKTEFMNSNRMAIAASYPVFIKYLEERGLTLDEINYICLYAIGLKGKEIGEYIQLKRHYNISSEIRRKLDIDEHETNIGIYIRKLMKELET